MKLSDNNFALLLKLIKLLRSNHTQKKELNSLMSDASKANNRIKLRNEIRLIDDKIKDIKNTLGFN